MKQMLEGQVQHGLARPPSFAAVLAATITVIAIHGDAKAQTAADKTLIVGAGSTFAAPLYDTWIKAFVKDKPALSISYDAVGSGEGISRFITGSLDFAGTDAPLDDKDAAMAQDRVLQIPSTAGMIVLAYNLSGFKGELRLPRDLYPEILAGNIRSWDDPRLQAANRTPNCRIGRSRLLRGWTAAARPMR